jgi:hypothetical protein
MMAVSKKMEEAPFDVEFTEHVAQAVVNAAWTRFDPDNPPEETASNEDEWLVMDADKGIDFAYYSAIWWEGLRVVRYADPQDLKFKGEE